MVAGNGMRPFVRTVAYQVAQARPDKVYVVTNDLVFLEALLPELGRTPVLVASSSERVLRALDARNVPTDLIADPPRAGFHVLDQTASLLSKAFAAGLLDSGDDVLAVIYTDLRGTFFFNVDEVGLANLRKQVGDAVPVELLEVIMQLAFEIAREGREGSHVGALFVLGDSERVMKFSRPRIINPFHGHGQKERLVFEPENWPTIKQYAMLDGATLVDTAGVAVAAGRYITINWDVYLQGGLGGRHLAGASITKDTAALAVVVSSSNVIRVFKGGREIYRVNA